jgi:RNA polymerase sigma-70 factor, ECF subfamily
MDSAASEEFDELYRTSRERLAVQIVALTGSLHDAEDAVQEAFVRAWLRWKTVGAYDDPEAWVRRVAYNLAVSRWRRRRKVVIQALVPAPRNREPAEPIGVVDAMKVLSLAQRRALVLHHLGGLSVSGIAEEMGVPEGTVKSWLSRARTRLSEELERREELTR